MKVSLFVVLSFLIVHGPQLQAIAGSPSAADNQALFAMQQAANACRFGYVCNKQTVAAIPKTFGQFYNQLKPMTDQLARTSRSWTRVGFESTDYAKGSTIANEYEGLLSEISSEYSAQAGKASQLIKSTLAANKDDTQFLSKYLKLIKDLRAQLAEELEGRRYGSYGYKAAMAAETRETQAKELLDQLESGFEESGISTWPTKLRDLVTSVSAGITAAKVGVSMSLNSAAGVIETGSGYVASAGEVAGPASVATMEVVGGYQVGNMLFNPKANPTNDIKYALSSSSAFATSSTKLSDVRRQQMQDAMAKQGLYDNPPTASAK